jgi:hypothetical protein
MFRNQEIDGELRRLERSAVGPSALRRSRGVLRLFVDRGKLARFTAEVEEMRKPE